MRNGFKFNNRHSSEFGVTVRTKSRPIRPSAKSFTMDLPYRDGEYDFSASNPHNREHYQNRIFTVALGVTADNLDELQRKISRLSLWLNGSGDLIFDDIPLVVWHGKITDEVIYMPERGGKNASLEVSFHVNPFASNIFGIEGPTLDMPIRLDSEIPLSLEEKYIHTVNGSGQVNVINFGDRPIRPRIKIEGGTGDIMLTLREASLMFAANGSVEIDLDKQLVTNASGSPVKVSGEFFEFHAGSNLLNIISAHSDTLTVTVYVVPEFMYSADYSEIDWGDGDA